MDDGSFIKCMRYAAGKGKNAFSHNDKDEYFYSPEDIICHMSPPYPTTSRYLQFSPEDFQNAVHELSKC